MKKKLNKSVVEGVSDEDDASSVASSAVSMSRQLSTVSIEDISEAINSSVNDIEAKRSSTREAGLTKLVRLLANRFLKSEISLSRQQEILMLICKSIRRGGRECCLASQAAGLMWITIGENPHFKEVYAILILNVKNSGFDSETRSASCLALALICWLQDVENSTILSVLGSLKLTFRFNV